MAKCLPAKRFARAYGASRRARVLRQRIGGGISGGGAAWRRRARAGARIAFAQTAFRRRHGENKAALAAKISGMKWRRRGNAAMAWRSGEKHQPRSGEKLK